MSGVTGSVSLSIVFGALLTISSTLFAWALLHFNQRRVNRDRTRRAIIHEVNHIAESVDEFIDISSGGSMQGDIDRIIITLSTDVLNEDLLQINKLTSPEVKNIYEFYESARVLEIKLENYQQSCGSQEEIKTAAERVLANRDRIRQTVKRSRLSLFTEWYKDRDREWRSK